MRGIFLVASLALFVNVSFAAEVCGNTGRSCVSGVAECVNGGCQCKASNPKGDGSFNCYPKNFVSAEVRAVTDTISTEILNDPMLKNFNDESVSFPFPCRYLTTHVLTELKDKRNNVIGSCEIMIHSFNAKYRGKFFLHGFDIALSLNYDQGDTVKMSSRHYGVGRNGKYRFRNSATNGEFFQNGPWGDDKIRFKDTVNGVKVRVKRDRDNNQLVYEAKRCGLRITFVPYDIKKRQDQVSVPGISIAINNRYTPRFLSNDDVMALAPKNKGGARLKDKKIRPLDLEQSMFVRAFKNEYVHNQPMDDKGKCDATHNAFGKCTRTELRKAMKNCYWIMKYPRFIYCMDKSHNARNILRLFSACLRAWCARSGECTKVQDMIVKANCDKVSDIEELPAFMNGSMCPTHTL